MTRTSRFSLTEEDRERLEGCRVVASISGGKDSAALSLWLTEQGIEHDRVFADTGWEHPLTYDYLRGTLTDKIGPIEEVQSDVGGFEEWCIKKGMFPSRLRRFCTVELKVVPVSKYLESVELRTGLEALNVVGIRASESQARSKLPRWEEASGKLEGFMQWRPLINWSEQDVIDMHKRHGLPPNPLYLQGAERVGCWPCIYSRKSEIRLVADIDPERIDRVRRLELLVQDKAEKRYAARGETYESLGYQRPTLFHAHNKRGSTTVPIDEAVEWARTDYGGKQMLMFSKEPPGCMRWGMCEGHKDEE